MVRVIIAEIVRMELLPGGINRTGGDRYRSSDSGHTETSYFLPGNLAWSILSQLCLFPFPPLR